MLPEIESPYEQSVIESRLSSVRDSIPFTLEVHQLIDSTNNYLKTGAEVDKLPLICLAEHQTAGHGRRGSSWISAYGQDICCSLAWEVADKYRVSGVESLSIALALAETFARMGIAGVQVKWPNDIYVKGKKICGILPEQIHRSGKTILIVGVGINVASDVHKGEQGAINATSIGSEIKLYNRNLIAALVIEALLNALNKIDSTLSDEAMAQWRRLDFLRGKWIEVEQKKPCRGRYAGIDRRGRLLLECGDETLCIASGHITEISP